MGSSPLQRPRSRRTRRASPSSGAHSSPEGDSSACSSDTSAPSGASTWRSCRTSSRASSTRRATRPSCSSAAAARRCATSSRRNVPSSRRASSRRARCRGRGRGAPRRVRRARAAVRGRREHATRLAHGRRRAGPSHDRQPRPNHRGLVRRARDPSHRLAAPHALAGAVTKLSPTRRSASAWPRMRAASTPNASRCRTPSTALRAEPAAAGATT